MNPEADDDSAAEEAIRRRRVAVAVSYADNAPTPKVVAKGRGRLAEAIIEQARVAGVFVHESPALVSLLMQVDLDEYIPPELYRAVAEVLAFIYLLEQGKDVLPPDFVLADSDKPML